MQARIAVDAIAQVMCIGLYNRFIDAQLVSVAYLQLPGQWVT
ncbi:hypothetical protein [Candidatus Viridilinea mediisalina]|nr:hypothetical protein [Candidatus Viridilinea mediisalina]